MHLTLHKAQGRSHGGTLTFTQAASQEKREAKPNSWNSGTNVMLGIESIHTIPLHQSPQDLAITLILAKASQFFSTKTKPPRNVSLHTHMHTLPCYMHACTHSPAICQKPQVQEPYKLLLQHEIVHLKSTEGFKRTEWAQQKTFKISTQKELWGLLKTPKTYIRVLFGKQPC